jgi:GH25 family lysozyme M1 (1,4-beta-N-acetylmuramidase)
VQFAILKVMNKNLTADKQFETNWKNATLAGVTIQGVYNYSYATTAAKAKIDAQAVLKILNGRKTMVWLDVEDNSQKKLGKTLIEIVKAYAQVITGAGLSFGVYTGRSFYNSYISPYTSKTDLPYPFWIARYPSSANVVVAYSPAESYKPKIVHDLYGWQYSSKGVVSGVSGAVDLNEWYVSLATEQGAAAGNYVVPKPTLKKGSSGAQVKYLQIVLNALISAGLTPDGVFGAKTEKALINWQSAAGLTADGKYGPKSQEAMAKQLAA